MENPPNQNSLIFNPPPPDCILYLPGLPGGGAVIQDRSSWGNHGSITGAVWKKLPGGLWCLDFDGVDDGVIITNRGSLDFGYDSFSLRLWLYLAGEYSDLIGRYQSAQAGRWGFSIRNTSTVRFYPDSGYVELASDNLAGKWQSLAFVIDTEDSAVYLYQQGKLRNSAAFTPQVFSSSIALTIGKYITQQWGCLRGRIALCSIHRRALSALEIQNAFNKEKHLFGAWQK
jgi:hypothetical protein